MALVFIALLMCQNLCVIGSTGLSNLAYQLLGLLLPRSPNKANTFSHFCQGFFFPLVIRDREEQSKKTKSGFGFKMKISLSPMDIGGVVIESPLGHAAESTYMECLAYGGGLFIFSIPSYAGLRALAMEAVSPRGREQVPSPLSSFGLV